MWAGVPATFAPDLEASSSLKKPCLPGFVVRLSERPSFPAPGPARSPGFPLVDPLNMCLVACGAGMAVISHCQWHRQATLLAAALALLLRVGRL